MLDYAGQNQKKVQQHKIVNHETTNTRTLDYITHIHVKRKDDIEFRWGEYLSDDEVNDILFDEILQSELEKIKPKNHSIELRL